MARFPVRYVLIIFLGILAMPQYAQLSLGVNTGATRMKFSGDPPDGIGFFSPKPGFSTAFQFHYRFNNGFGLSAQPGYSILRSKYSVMNDSATKVVDSSNFIFNSLSLPLQIIVWSDNGQFYVLAGIEICYTLDFKGKILLNPTTQANESIYEIADFTYYANFGAGFIIPLGRPYLSFEIRYSQGLNDLTAPLIHLGSVLPRTKLTNIHLLLGIHVPLGNPEMYHIRNKSR